MLFSKRNISVRSALSVLLRSFVVVVPEIKALAREAHSGLLRALKAKGQR